MERVSTAEAESPKTSTLIPALIHHQLIPPVGLHMDNSSIMIKPRPSRFIIDDVDKLQLEVAAGALNNQLEPRFVQLAVKHFPLATLCKPSRLQVSGTLARISPRSDVTTFTGDSVSRSKELGRTRNSNPGSTWNNTAQMSQDISGLIIPHTSQQNMLRNRRRTTHGMINVFETMPMPEGNLGMTNNSSLYKMSHRQTNRDHIRETSNQRIIDQLNLSGEVAENGYRIEAHYQSRKKQPLDDRVIKKDK